MISLSRVFKAATQQFYLREILHTFDRDNQLRNDGQDFSTTFLKHVKDTLHSEEAVGILLLANPLEEDRQVVVVVELCDVDLPEDAVVGRSVDRGDREVTSVVKTAEVGRVDLASVLGVGTGLLGGRLDRRCQKRSGFATVADSFSDESYTAKLGY